MTKSPAILMIDGYRAGRYSTNRHKGLNTLVAAIAEDHLFDLLERLYLPPTPKAAQEIYDFARFEQNRCIIFSDDALFEQGMMPTSLHPHPLLRSVIGQSIRVPPPDHTAIHDILPSFGNQSQQQIAKVEALFQAKARRGNVLLQQQFSDHCELLEEEAKFERFGEVRLPEAESVYGVLSCLLMKGWSTRPRDGDVKNEETILEHLLEGLLENLRGPDAEIELLFVGFLAIAPGGLRANTLIRAVEHFNELSTQKAGCSRSAITEKLGKFLCDFNGLFGFCREDSNDLLGGRSLPLAHRRKIDHLRLGVPESRAILFAYEKVREYIRKSLEATSRDKIALLHLVLAEDAYEQAVHQARFDDRENSQPIYLRNRLLAAIYHGCASLRNNKLEPSGDGLKDNGSPLPADPLARWIKLYTIVYYRDLNKANLFELIQRYDAGLLARDILRLLARPQLAYLSSDPTFKQEEEPDKWTLPRSDDEHLATTFNRFELDFLRAHEAIGETVKVKDQKQGTLAELAELPTSSIFSDTGRSGTKQMAEVAVDSLPSLIESIKEGKTPDGWPPRIKLHELLSRWAQDLAPEVLDLSFMVKEIQQLAIKAVNDPDFDARTLSEPFEGIAVRKPSVSPIHVDPNVAQNLALAGEALGVEFDFNRETRNSSPSAGSKGRLNTTQIAGFAESFAKLFVSESLRRYAYWANPTTPSVAIRGRAGRSLIRCSLILERQRKLIHEEKEGKAISNGAFWSIAQATSDSLARHLSHLPRERAGMLVLDAKMARFSVDKHTTADAKEGLEFLDMALACLSEAEGLLVQSSLHHRLALRFAYDRMLLFCDLAACREINDEPREHLVALARSEQKRLMGVSSQPSNIWHRLGERQEAILTALGDQSALGVIWPAASFRA